MGNTAVDSGGRFARFQRALFAPVDNASLVFFRIAFGLILVWEVARYFSKDWIAAHFIEPQFHFKYFGFGWVEPLPGPGMYILFGLMGILGFCIAAGILYRYTTSLFALCFIYMFLIEETRYLNHFYLVALLSLLMIVVPAHRSFSVDAKIRPGIRSQTAPAWTLWLLRGQLAVVYIWGGIHKTNPDWLRGQPMRNYLYGKQHLFPDAISQILIQEWSVYMFVIGGLLLDLFVVPALLWRPTRIPAFILVTAFHLFNAYFFTIGIFPWLMICATMLFFPPSWPRTLLRAVARRRPFRESPADEARAQFFAAPFAMTRNRLLITGAFVAWLTAQALIPIRPYLHEGHMLWSERSTRFSWNMMLVSKQGDVVFEVYDPRSNTRWIEYPEKYITPFQSFIALPQPDMVHQLALHIAKEYQEKGYTRVEVYAKSLVSMNGREPQPLVDPDVDLAQERRSLARKPWLMPLKQPYPPKEPWQGQEITEANVTF